MKLRFFHTVLCALIFNTFTIHGQSTKKDTIDYFNLSLEDLMNLEIVAVSKKAENSFDAPLSSSIITRDEIINSGATCIEEVFKLIPGFIVREESNGNYDIHIRGNDNVPPGNFTFFSENSMSLIMIDGRKVFNNMNGGTFWETLPVSLTDVERIEVIRGASTALYGPNAVSGVVNIITRKPMDKTIGVDGTVQFANAATTIGDLAISSSFANHKLKTRLSTNFEERERFSDNYYNWSQGGYTDYTELVDYITTNPTMINDLAYANPSLAKQRFGANAWVSYEASKKVNFSVAAGLQNSEAQTVFMEGSKTPLTTRSSESFYFNSISNIADLNLQIAGNYGTQDIYAGSSTASKYDFHTLDFLAEYDYSIGNLTLRPGASYQHIVHDDTPYIPEEKPGSGNLNRRSTLSNLAYYLRSDYQVNKRLRLIAAIRMDHYNKPEKSYLSYQLIGTYKPNEQNLIRASFSKANRGPVMVDFYASYTEGDTNPGSTLLEYVGKNDMNLPTSHVFDFGYRTQVSDRLQIDVEAFLSTTKEFPSFEPSVKAPTADAPYLHITYQYDNSNLVSRQIGASAHFLYKPNKQLHFKLFTTVQNTRLSNLQKKRMPMLVIPDNSIPGGPIFQNPVYETVDQTHKQTPTIFGGFLANYMPTDKLTAFANLYYCSKQQYVHDYEYSQFHYLNQQLNSDYTGTGAASVKGNATVSIKVAYKIYRNNSIFINARNTFNSKTRQFGFADPAGGLYLAGINIKL
ncbi:MULTISPECIES: TonB-dependent receptor plug domain-containing protein [unclassified Carboxylicivirga]|uniref:TonB-dependent receptor plug domain-containing protein n=1 Tax=Carboxylicivirga TaxID=1628153 RepID=UPI003D3498D5